MHQTQLQARPAFRPLSCLDEQDLGRKKETYRADSSHLRPLMLFSRTYLFSCTSFLSVPCRAPLPGQARPLAPAGSAAPLHREDRGSGWHSWSHQETVYKLICWGRGSEDGWTVRPPLPGGVRGGWTGTARGAAGSQWAPSSAPAQGDHEWQGLSQHHDPQLWVLGAPPTPPRLLNRGCARHLRNSLPQRENL